MSRNFLFLLFLFYSISLFSQNTSKPKLIVGIVVDQMCYEYLYRYENKLSPNGFLKLMQNGTVCHNAQYNYIPTYTGPGHASIYTGTTPDNHGIIANDWYDRSGKKEINCVGDSTVKSIGTNSIYGMKSPKNLLTNTITDQLKLNSPNSKIISISIKDRGAILPGGHLSNGSYWFDYATGHFITSSFFKSSLPQWVQNFNKENYVINHLKQTWNTLYPIEKYTESGPDNSPYEALLPGKKTPEFPYDFKEMNQEKTDMELFTLTPFSNTYLTNFAIDALKYEELGLDEAPDFLAVSYSTPDAVGHAFGPYSVEIEDIYLRLDIEIEKLIDQLEATIGKDNFILFLTADHAVVPVPQFLIDKKLPGGYFYTKQFHQEISAKLSEKYGFNPISDITNNNIYLDRKSIAQQRVDQEEIENFIANNLREQKGIKKVYTQEDIQESGSNDKLLQMIQHGYRYQESGDIIFVLESGHLSKSEDKPGSHKGTSHGSGFNYDTQVPLIWYGKGIPAQSLHRRIDIVDIAASLAPILYIQRPDSCTGEPILELLNKY